MNETPIDYGLLATFVAVADEQNFTRAAAKRGTSKGTVSRSVTRLEEQLGIELIHRTTHTVSLSTAGIALYERVAPHVTALSAAVRGLPESGAEPSGLLRLTAPKDFGATVLPEIIVQFTRRHPAVDVDLRIVDSFIDLVEEGFDAAIRIASKPLKDSTLIARLIARGNVGLYASPSYLSRRGKPKTFGSVKHDWIVPPFMKTLKSWKPETKVRIWSNDFLFNLEVARHGGGVAVLPRFLPLDAVREGALEELSVKYPADGPTGKLMLLYPSSGQVPRKVTAFRDFLVGWFDKSPLP